jgi:hypothetical protein
MKIKEEYIKNEYKVSVDLEDLGRQEFIVKLLNMNP